MLTSQQQEFFATFGFLCMRDYFSPDEMNDFSRTFDELLDAN